MMRHGTLVDSLRSSPLPAIGVQDEAKRLTLRGWHLGLRIESARQTANGIHPPVKFTTRTFMNASDVRHSTKMLTADFSLVNWTLNMELH